MPSASTSSTAMAAWHASTCLIKASPTANCSESRLLPGFLRTPGRQIAYHPFMKRVLAALLAAIPLLAFAQPITAEQKAEVLKGVEDIVLKRAFIPGVDFSKWPEFLAKQKETIDAATEIPAFTTAV